MKRWLAGLALFTLSSILIAQSTTPLIPPKARVHSATISPILQHAMPAIVNILASGKMEMINDPFLKKQLEQENPGQMQRLQNTPFRKLGSGVIIDAKKGIIVTNAHVISEAQNIIINLSDGRKYSAKIIGADNDTDIAVLQINAKNLAALSFANSDELQVGDFVAAIGNPFGLQQTVTSGIVSGLHRSNLKLEGYENFIQTDAPINTGNSGGALIDSQGYLVGINTAILANNEGSSMGIGFAIPSNMVKSVTQQIIKYGKVQRGILGVMVQSLNPQLADALNASGKKGTVVTQVIPFSPAAKAGIQVGDILLSLNGTSIDNNGEVRTMVALMRTGDKIHLRVLRNGKVLPLTATVGDPKLSEAEARLTDPFLYGLTLRNVIQQTKRSQYLQGVYVVHVEPNTLPWSMGITRGDIIVSANLKPIHNIEELKQAAEKAKDHLLLRVVGKGGSFFILLQ